jgi:hypothetical protein
VARAYKSLCILRKRSRPDGRRKTLKSRPNFSESGPRYRGRGLDAEASNPTPIGRTFRAGSVTETETEKSVFRKTETETDVGVEKTEKNR